MDYLDLPPLPPPPPQGNEARSDSDEDEDEALPPPPPPPHLYGPANEQVHSDGFSPLRGPARRHSHEPPMFESPLPPPPAPSLEDLAPPQAERRSEQRPIQRKKGWGGGHLQISLSSSLPGIAKILAEMLLPEPAFEHLFPEAALREEWLLSYCKGVLSHVLHKKGFIAVAGTEPGMIQSAPGVIAAYPPKTYPPGKLKAAAMRWNLVIHARNRTKPPLITEGIRVFDILKDNHPKEPHWFIAALGVEGSRQREGIASELVEAVLRKAEADQVPVYAKTSSQEAAKFYGTLGFHSHEALVFDNAPDVYILVRKPLPRKTASHR
eukprot:TRINITY_DN1686_c0_g2_i1.p1 TRINITY_DN1686_c0_g2~~TRINITY_DN1686_c0_g2_i1.p1  ORF type:complete len:323 (-),score=66.19 TRINITY_DN1686_c0_g2_i1:40-1008(-)